MGLELWYKGSIHRFNGYGMSYANLENKISTDELNKKVATGVNDLYVSINEASDDEVHFSVVYFDKETKYSIKKGEEVNHKYEGNAFGFELVFSLRG